MNLLSSICFTASFLFILTGLYIFCFNGRDRRNTAFFIMSLCLALWTFGYSFIFASADESSVFFWYRLSSLGWCTFPAAVLTLGAAFYLRRDSGKWRLSGYLLALPSIAWIYQSMRGVLYAEDFLRQGNQVLGIVAMGTPWFQGFVAWGVLCHAAAWSLLLLHRRKTHASRLRRQALMVFLCLAFPGIVHFIFSMAPLVTDMVIPVAGPLAFFPGMAGIAYFLVRYRPLSLSESVAGDKIISQMMDILFCLGPDGTIERINRQVQLLLGYREEEILGRPLHELVGDSSMVKKIAAVGKENCVLYNEMVKIPSKSGERITFDLSASPLLDEFGEPFGTVIIGHDIRDRLELEKRNAIMEKELRLAQQIQKGIIPAKPPQIPGAVISSLYRPLAMLGGDFYDFLKLPDPRLTGIFIGDVSGHGVPAALITSMIKTMLETAGDLRLSPGSLLEYINRTITGQIGGNFITAVYGIYDGVNRTFRYSRGGHDYPLLIRDGSLEVIKSHGRILGIENDVTYQETCLTLQPGDKLVIYTDGLREEFNYRGEQFDDVLHKEILAAAAQPADRFISVIHSSLLRFKGGSPFHDDVSIVCLEVL